MKRKHLAVAALAGFLAACLGACSGPDSAKLLANKQLVLLRTEAINGRNLDALEALLKPEFRLHCQATPVIDVYSLAQFKDFLRQDAATCPDSKITWGKLVAQGNLVAIYGRYAGTQTGQMGPFPPSGKQVELDVSGMFRIDDGKIAELWITWDNLAAMTQLGHTLLPQQTAR